MKSRICYLCGHSSYSAALFVGTLSGWRCKSGAACQRRIRAKTEARKGKP